MYEDPDFRKTGLGLSGDTSHHSRLPADHVGGLREWLGIRELSVYANVSERTLRLWIRLPRDPLPATRVRGKVLVRKSDFDRFLERHRVQPLATIDVERIVDEVLGQHH